MQTDILHSVPNFRGVILKAILMRKLWRTSETLFASIWKIG